MKGTHLRPQFRWIAPPLVVLVACLAVTTSASALDLKVMPAKPYVDDEITVSFTTKKKLKSGWHFEASVLGRIGDCAGFAMKATSKRGGKNKRVSIRVSPYDDNLNGGPEWCQGKASVTVSKVKDADRLTGNGSIVGIESFRFYALP